MVIYTPVISGSLIISGSIVTTSGGLPLTGSLVSSGSFTSIGPTIVSGSLTVITGSSIEFQVLDTGVRIGNLASDNHTVTGSLLVSGSITGSGFLTTGTITAQTLVVQTVTSSTDFVTGSTRFGSLSTNTHQFTGSLLVTGSTTLSGSLTVVTSNSPGLNISKDASVDNRYIRLTNTQASSKNWDLVNQTNALGNNFLVFNATDNISPLVITPSGSVTFGNYLSNNHNITGSVYLTGSLISNFIYGGSYSGNRIVIDGDTIKGYYISDPDPRFLAGRDVYANGQSGISFGYTGYKWAGIGTLSAANNAGTALLFSVNSTTPTNLALSGSEMMRINTSGVGIGVTSVSYKLDVANSGGGVFGATVTGAWSSGFLNHSNFMLPNMTGGGLSIAFGKANSTNNVAKLVYNHVGDGSTSNYIGLGFWDNDNKLAILAGGNVGIGTTSPSFKLSVANEMIVGAQGGTDYTYLRGGSGFGSMIRNYYAGGSVNNELSGNSNNLFSLVTGNVGIGIASPTQKLDVYGNMAINDQEFRWRTGTDANHATKYDSTTNGPFMYGYFGAALGYNTGTGTNTRVIWTNTTNAYNYNNSTTWQQTSDQRVKQNINSISNAIDKISLLNPVIFDYTDEFASQRSWSDKYKLNNVGFIAQEYENVFPDDVDEIEETVGDIVYEDFKTINTTSIVPYLVKAIQELKAENDTLKEILQRNNIQ